MLLSNISQFKLVFCLNNYPNNQADFFNKFEVIILNLKIEEEKEDCYYTGQNGGVGHIHLCFSISAIEFEFLKVKEFHQDKVHLFLL